MQRLLLVAVVTIGSLCSRAEESPPDRLSRGIAAARAGNCEAALPDLRASLPAASQFVPGVNALGVCEAKVGNLEQAAAAFERIVQLEPGRWEGWNNLGRTYLAASQPERAIPAFERAVKLSPNSSGAWFQLGVACGALKRHADSFRAYDHAQKLAPSDPEIVNAWLQSAAENATEAANLIEKKEYSQARILLLPLNRPFANSASWHNLIGYAEFKLEHPEPALEHLQKALTLEPDNEDYLLDMGEFLAYYRAPKNAVDVFEIASRRMPDSIRVQLGLAVSYILLERRDEATSILEAVLAAHEDYEPVYRALGECYEDAGNWEGLAKLGRKLRLLNASNPLGWYFDGASLLRNTDGPASSASEAIIALEHAAKLDPASARIQFTLAKAYQAAGRNDAAIEELKQTLRLDPSHERAHYVLGRLYQEEGKTEAAKEQFAEHSKLKVKSRQAEYRQLLITSRNP